MKNTFLYILTIVIIIVILLLSKITENKRMADEIKKFNSVYESCLDKEVYGVDIATLINKAMNDNEKANVKKDEENYININIKIIDLEKETIYDMETFYNGGIAQFVQYYSNILFKCTEIKYAQDGKVNYLFFEQTSI